MTAAMHYGFEIGAPASSAAPGENATIHAAYLPMVETFTQRLVDGFDHPEVWTLLRVFRGDPAARGLLAALRSLLPIQRQPSGIKLMETLIGVLVALIEDKTAGLVLLKQMEARHVLCPQVAGACFFVDRLDDPVRSADLSTRFCDAPFIKFETLVDGTVAPCCSIWTRQRLGHLDRQSFAQIWNSPAAQAMRESILDGSFRYCNKQRCTFILEDTLPERKSITNPPLRKIIDEGRTELDTPPGWLFLAHDPTCNLACPSCRAGLEIATPAQEARFDTIMRNVLQPLLDSGDNLKVSISGQGDPWSSHHYRAILRHIADNPLSIDLVIHTNALLMDEKRWKDYAGLARYKPTVDVSIDAASPWVYEHVRRPGKWPRLIENLRFIARERALGNVPLFTVNATIQLDNFHEIPALVALGEDLGADEMRLYMIQNTGAHLGGSFSRLNVADQGHPLHLAFLETLRHPCLVRPIVHLYDVATWRAIALDTHLPSDDLGVDWLREAALEAIRASIGENDFARAAALCAAIRVRFPDDVQILPAEGAVLDGLGFKTQGDWRRAMAGA